MSEEETSTPQAATHPRRRRRLTKKAIRGFIWSAVRGVAAGALVTSIMLGATMLFEQSDLGHEVGQWLYGKLNLYGFSPARGQHGGELPVLVVDISALEPRAKNRKDEPVTPRQKLINLINAIADNGAIAIGVDVNLGPRDSAGRKLTEEDRKLLEACDAISREKKIPIRVAVGERSQYGAEEDWLGDPLFSDLAASATILKNDSRCLPLKLEHPDGRRLIGLAAALACNAGARVPETDEHAWFGELTQYSIPPPNQEWIADCYWIDYAFLDRIRGSNSVAGFLPSVIEGAPWKAKNKIVLIGAIHQTSDAVSVPGVSSDPVPGVLVHACGVMTLLSGSISQPGHKTRLLFDILISSLVILAVLAVRMLFFIRRREDVVNEHGAHRFFTVIAIVLVAVGGNLLAWHYRVLWADSFIVAATLALHGPVEKWIANGWRVFKLVFDRMVFKGHAGS